MENENKTEDTKAGGDSEASATTETEKVPQNDKKDVVDSEVETKGTATAAENKNNVDADGDEASDKKADKDKEADTAEIDDEKPKAEPNTDNKSDDKSTPDSGDDKKIAKKDKLADVKEDNDSKDEGDVTDDEKKTDVKEKNGTVAGAAGGTTTAADKKKPVKDQGKEKNDKKLDKNKEDDKDEEDGEDDAPSEEKNKEVAEDDENVVALAEIDRINDNINKTRVDGLQTLHELCFGSVGKNNVVKKNLRSFAGFEFEKDSSEYKKKFDAIKKTDAKALKGICDILTLERKGTKDEIANRVLTFLMEPDESLCVDEAAEGEEEDIEEEPVEEEDDEEVSAEEDHKRKPSRAPARNSSSGRPRRATAGKKMSAYVDFSSSDEGERNTAPAKRKRHEGSESGSDYNPSGGNSDSDGARGRKQIARGSRGGRPARKSWKKNSDSEEEELSDADSDVPKRKRSTSGKRGRPSAGATNKRGARGRSAKATKSRKRHDSESEEEEISEDEEEEEMSDFGSDHSEEKEESKKFKKPSAPVKNAKSNNKAKTPVKGKVSGRQKKASKNNDSDDEDEPLTKKGKATFPTDEQIRNYVKEILDKANLEEITMKTVCKQVYAKYPDFDLTDKKDFIKATVKALIAA